MINDHIPMVFLLFPWIMWARFEIKWSEMKLSNEENAWMRTNHIQLTFYLSNNNWIFKFNSANDLISLAIDCPVFGYFESDSPFGEIDNELKIIPSFITGTSKKHFFYVIFIEFNFSFILFRWHCVIVQSAPRLVQHWRLHAAVDNLCCLWAY